VRRTDCPLDSEPEVQERREEHCEEERPEAGDQEGETPIPQPSEGAGDEPNGSQLVPPFGATRNERSSDHESSQASPLAYLPQCRHYGGKLLRPITVRPAFATSDGCPAPSDATLKN